MTAPAIVCSGLEKTFKDFWMRPRVKAVKGIDLQLQPGSLHGLLGPNGSGKSTTIKMLLGLLHPTAGKVAVLGRHPKNVANKQDIGYLPEESYLHRHMTARETLDFYGKLFHLPTAIRKQRIEALLDMVGMSHAANRYLGEFSKGMMRKIGLAQAMINDPQLLILDEPTSGMDPIATAEVKEVLLQLRQRGKSILLCSHHLSDVQDICDSITLMYGGRVIAQGPMPATIEQAGHDQLEQFFLDRVKQAQQQQFDTAGARSGGGVANFLGSEDTPVRPTKAIVANKPTTSASQSVASATTSKADKPPALQQAAQMTTQETVVNESTSPSTSIETQTKTEPVVQATPAETISDTTPKPTDKPMAKATPQPASKPTAQDSALASDVDEDFFGDLVG